MLSLATGATVVGSGIVGMLVLFTAVVGVLLLTATVVGVLLLTTAVGGGAAVSLVAEAQPTTSSDRLTRSGMAMDRCIYILVCYDMSVLYYNEWYLLCI
jgi:hypothetical protein